MTDISRYMKQKEAEQQFLSAYHQFGDAIFRFCLVKVSNKELAEDITQETFIKYWQYLRDGKDITNTRSLLYTIANNAAKDWYKKKKAVSLEDRLEVGKEPIAVETPAEVQAAYNEALETISELEESDREVLLLTHVEGLPPREIAEMLGESANTISVRINRATKRLRKALHV